MVWRRSRLGPHVRRKLVASIEGRIRDGNMRHAFLDASTPSRRFCGGRGDDGLVKNKFYLVSEEDQLAGPDRVPGRRRHLYRPGQPVSNAAVEASKTRTSFYRRLYVAWLISQGTDTVPAIMEATGMPRRSPSSEPRLMIRYCRNGLGSRPMMAAAW